MLIKKLLIWIISAIAVVGTSVTVAVTVDWKKDPEVTSPIANVITYDGEVKELVSSGATTGGSLLFAIGNETEATGEFSENIPSATNAGTYYVWYKVQGDKKFHDVEPSCIEVKINKKKVNEPTITTNSFIYDGNEKEVELNGVEAYMTKSNDSVVKASVKGDYIITYTLDNNHEWNTGSDGVLNWSITKASATITVDTTPIVVTYGDSVVIPIASSNLGTVVCDKTAADLVNAGTYTITYTIAEAADYSGDTKTVSVTINQKELTVPTLSGAYTYNGLEQAVAVNNFDSSTMEYANDSVNKAINVGSYVVKVNLKDSANYKWVSLFNGELGWNIAKSAATITVDTTPIVVTYGDSVVIPTASSNLGTVTCDKTASDLVNAGTYTITYKVVETADYTGDTKTVSVTINKKELTVPTFSGSYTYTGSEQTVTVNNFDSSTMEYLNDSVNEATDAGSYIVKISLKDSSNYKWASSFDGEIGWSISKAKVDEPTLTTSTFVFDNTEKEVEINGVESYMTRSNDSVVKATLKDTYTITYTLDNNHEWNTGSDGVLTWSITKNQATITVDTTPIVKTYGESVTIPEASSNFGTVTCDKVASDLVNAGTYTITYTVSETDDYSGDTKTVSVTINKKEVTVPTVSGTYTFNGSNQSVTINSFDSSTMEYANDSVNEATNAGSYVVKVNLKDSSNYKWASSFNGEIGWNIAKAKVDEPTLTTNSFTYDGNEKEVEINGVEAFMTKSNDSVVKASVKGDYTITYTLDNNHEWNTGSDGVLNWSITKAQASITVDTTSIVKTYGESVEIPTATSNFGIVTCDKVASDLVNAGSYTITYTVEGTDNYNGDTKTISVTINKATPIYTAPVAITNLVYNTQFQLAFSTAGLVNDSNSYHWEYKYKLFDYVSNYSSQIIEASIAGTYTVSYKLVVTNSNYSDPNIESSFELTVAKLTPTVTAPVSTNATSEGIGIYKPLCTVGSTDYGTLLYKLGQNGFAESNPPQAYTQGIYYVYYWVVGDSNINDVAEQCVVCTLY